MKKLLPVFLFMLMIRNSYGQLPDSLQINAGSVGTIAQKGYQPLWITANRWGAFSNQQYDASTYAGFSNVHVFGKNDQPKSNPGQTEQPLFYVKYGANLISNNHFQTVTLQEAYVKAGYKHLELRAGRFKYIPGEVDQDLSSGSLGVSGNALPIPQITLGLTDYVNVPFTNGWLQIKAQLSHGWLGSNRYLNSYYHEKNIYLRAGKKRFRFFAGAQHYAEWGGQRNDISLDRSFNGFLNVVFARSNADDGTGIDPAMLIYGPYHAGDQRGLFELGFDLETNQHLIHFYHQTPFDGTWSVDIRNIDNLSGISIAPKNKSGVIKKVLAEFIYTLQMENYAPQLQRQGYYNNGYYRTGWEYNNQIVGTPLFINRYRAQDYPYFQEKGIKPFDWNSSNIPGNSNIIYNGIVGGNIGLLLQFGNRFSGKTKLTYTSGKYQGSASLNQFYGLQEVYFSAAKNLNVSVGFALDAGDFSHNTGGLIGLHWQLKKDR
ncbi:MAG: hypothetical protein EOP41_06990 [Sphingobacteriaceae bacterium]|nr:MAG: hypothetical protein EOP41_06990 [Sphingobacteriaceae bacterium]